MAHYMRQMTVSLREEQAKWIESLMGENGEFESKSEAVRWLIDDHEALQEEIEELEETIDELEGENDRLRDQLAATNQRIDDVNDLVEYVDSEREMARYQDRRQRMLDQASILSRWKWKLTGIPVEDRAEE